MCGFAWFHRGWGKEIDGLGGAGEGEGGLLQMVEGGVLVVGGKWD